jgi:transposase InsO family protein
LCNHIVVHHHRAFNRWREALAAILDLYSRFVVGWAVTAANDRHLTSKPLAMPLKRRCPDAGLLHHSDQGCTYASEDYQRLLDAVVESSPAVFGWSEPHRPCTGLILTIDMRCDLAAPSAPWWRLQGRSVPTPLDGLPI